MERLEGYISFNQQQFNGSGPGSGHYDEYEEKRERWSGAVVLTWVLFGIFICLAMTTYLFVHELNYKMNGTKQTVVCNTFNNKIGYQAPDGNTYMVDIEWANKKQNTVDIYYLGQDYGNAIALTFYQMWIICYGGFGVLFVIVLYCIIRRLQPKNHAIDESKDGIIKKGFAKKERSKKHSVYSRK